MDLHTAGERPDRGETDPENLTETEELGASKLFIIYSF
jgi:hypothetical protein